MTHRPTTRDRVAHRMANAALRLAGREYRDFLTVVIALGCSEFDRLAKEAAK